jgi:oxygen-independent coproporphyrinogen-3 oxidase
MALGVYVQVPFCQTKCTYCNFHTGVFSQQLYTPYVDAVCREIANATGLYAAASVARDGFTSALPVDTVYVGGGTPSLLAPASLGRLLDAIRASFPSALLEVTLEADPETVSAQKAREWRAIGFDRISLGAQSFHDVELRAIARMHRAADISLAVQYLRAAGFSNVSCDLIIGLPHQTPESWRRTLEELAARTPEHVSIYMLEIDAGSRLGREVLAGGARYSAGAIPDDDQIADSYDLAREFLAGAGYHHYEISNWARPGFESQHNLKYWRREPYLGFGAGAHSFLGRERWANTHDPAAYVAAIERGTLPIEQHELLSDSQVREEEFFLGLRQLDGMNLDKLAAVERADVRPRIERLIREGLLQRDGDRLRLAPQKLSISNEVFVELLELPPHCGA